MECASSLAKLRAVNLEHDANSKKRLLEMEINPEKPRKGDTSPAQHVRYVVVYVPSSGFIFRTLVAVCCSARRQDSFKSPKNSDRFLALRIPDAALN